VPVQGRQIRVYRSVADGNYYLFPVNISADGTFVDIDNPYTDIPAPPAPTFPATGFRENNIGWELEATVVGTPWCKQTQYAYSFTNGTYESPRSPWSSAAVALSHTNPIIQGAEPPLPQLARKWYRRTVTSHIFVPDATQVFYIEGSQYRQYDITPPLQAGAIYIEDVIERFNGGLKMFMSNGILKLTNITASRINIYVAVNNPLLVTLGFTIQEPVLIVTGAIFSASRAPTYTTNVQSFSVDKKNDYFIDRENPCVSI
jgi:hypothetical protein